MATKKKTKKKPSELIVQHPGALHRALGVPEGKKIPASKMRQALHSKDPHIRRMALNAVGPLANMRKKKAAKKKKKKK